MGRVRSIKRIINHYNGFGFYDHLYEGKSKKLIKDKNNYLSVILSKKSRQERCLVHRLVAEAFIPNPNSLPEVNHKDCNPMNNCFENLEWCTHLQNVRHSVDLHRHKTPNNCKPILLLDNNGIIIKEYESSLCASKDLNVARSTVCGYLKGTFKKNKFILKYKGDE